MKVYCFIYCAFGRPGKTCLSPGEVLEKSWKSPGKLFLKKGTNPGNRGLKQNNSEPVLYVEFILQIDLRHFANAEETCHYLLITAGMFGLVNQPLKKVCALHLAGTAAQAIGTNSMLDTGVSAFSEAVHILCDMLDISHASLLLQRAGAMLDTSEPSDTAKVQFLLAKSHYLLVTGKVSLSG